ncbi:response regulator [Taibaiella chishuiensis]|uniref:histidine kinase n=1 Tax=Taibaiella chishuiensis TaxID=1434707 RepID=A0A2P8CXP1_9BACT|nr:response regulator [Taibaiella chishuiensis]PSK89744.1 signal transduction histidine kinase [Taibaiella chishuiensis]
MRYTKLNYQLFLGLSLAIVLVAALGGLSLYSSYQSREAELWFNHTLLVKAKLQDINVGIKDNTANIRTLRKYENSDTLFRNANEKTIHQEVVDLRQLVDDNPSQSRKADDLKTRIDGLFRLWNTIDIRTTRLDPVRERAYFTEEIKHIAGINVVLQQMNGEEDLLLKSRKAHASSFANMNKWFNIGGTVLVLFIVIALSMVIAAELKKRRRAEHSLQRNLEKLETMNEKTRLHNEVLNGVQQLVEACQSATDVDGFASAVLLSITRFLNLPAGVVYLVKENDDKKLSPVSYTGIPEQQARPITVQQLPVARDGARDHVAVVKDVPAGFWKTQTAIGSSTPGSIAYLFLENRGRLAGVIELGSFVPFTDKALDYFQNIANVVSVRLATALVQQNRNELMEELQEKQEILINQQEELRLANDELTHQTHILQASEEELRVQEEELKQINVELEEKNEALESAKEVLAFKASELEVSGKYKSEFLANMSHELRTPLNSVLILAGLLSDNKDNNLTERQVEYARIIHNSGSDLLKLINDILDLSKIEAGKIDLVIESFAPSGMLENMRQMFAVVAEEKGIVFKTQQAPDVPELMSSDRQRLEQILKNLLSNAMKFTPKNETVTLQIRTGEINQEGHPVPGLHIEVKDTGIGIGKEKQQLIFEAFKQADGSTNRKYGGTGLGLSISKELARILGGSITIQSEEHKGSTFTISIPLHYPEHQKPLLVTTHKEQPVPEVLQPLRPAADGNRRTILIIEDDANFASILQDFAEERNYKALHAADGKIGMEMAAAHIPDAIILDLQMPVMDGWEVLHRLKDDEQLKDIPVHIISAIDEIRMPKEGAVAYLKKPVSKESLEHTFQLIGSQMHDRNRHLLILPGDSFAGEFLERFVNSIPEGIDYRFADDIEACRKLAQEQDFDCVIADIGMDIDEGIRRIEALKNIPAFRKVSVILMINREISAADEIKLKKVSEAVVMKSEEAQRRLTDELELFLHRINDKPETVRFNNNNIHPLERNELKGKRVLIADDDMRNVFALVSMLEDQEMEVETASNGREAVDMLESGMAADLVLMDIMMPEMDGYEAMGYIRNKLQMKSLPIIAITAKAMADDRELCLAAGASDYISKPVDTQKLRSLLRVWLSQ